MVFDGGKNVEKFMGKVMGASPEEIALLKKLLKK